MIGGFCHPRAACFLNEPQSRFSEDYTLSARLFSCGLALWILCLEINILNFVQNGGLAESRQVSDCFLPVSPSITNICESTADEHTKLFFFSKLLISMDVERQPGPYTPTLEDINNNILRLHDEITNIRDDYRKIRKNVEQNEMNIKDLWSYSEDIRYRHDESIQFLSERINFLERRNEYQERYSRKENIILKGVPGPDNDSMKQRVVNILNSADVSRGWKNEQIQRAHRLRSNGSKLGHIIVRFVHFEDKLKALKLREKLGEKNVGVTNDLTQNQRNQLSDLRKENKRGYFLRNRLIVENIQPSDNTHRIRSGSNAIEDDVIRSGTNENVHANDLNPSSQPVRGSGHRRGGGSGRGSRNYVNNAGSSLRDHDRDRAHDRTSRRVGGSDDRQNTSSQNSLVRRGAGRGRAGRAVGELRSRDSRGGAGSLDDWIHRAGTSGHHTILLSLAYFAT